MGAGNLRAVRHGVDKRPLRRNRRRAITVSAVMLSYAALISL